MNRNVLFALAIIATPAMAGCTGSTTPQQTEISTPVNTPSVTTIETPVTIDGMQWTCKDIVDTSSEHCNKLMQRAFNDYSWNLNSYISNGNLDKLKAPKEITSKEIAFVGLIACATMTGAPNYEDYLLAFEHDERFKTLASPKPALTDAWFAAEKLLCFTEDEANS